VTKTFVNTPFHMTSKQIRPTKLELAILKVLWEAGPRSVRDIQAILSEAKPTGYTTVLKMLQIMTEKGLVDKDETVRPQIYRARYSQEQTQRHLLSDLAPARIWRFGKGPRHAGPGDEEIVGERP
jgi:predicted transcriptional regulator